MSELSEIIEKHFPTTKYPDGTTDFAECEQAIEDFIHEREYKLRKELKAIYTERFERVIAIDLTNYEKRELRNRWKNG